MGLDINTLHLLTHLERSCSNPIDAFSHILTIGRLDLNIFPKTLKKHLGKRYNSKRLYLHADDLILSLFSPVSLHSLDYSDYEGATLLHDLNTAIPPVWHNHFGLVIEGGTLEHVFNFPQAIQNLMSVVKPGGYLLLQLPCNGWPGHGFYQFSPELFHNLFNRTRGWDLELCIIHRIGPWNTWYKVQSPSVLKDRVEFLSLLPYQILIVAQKIKHIPDWPYPQQSDYVQRWRENIPGSKSQPYTAPRPWLASKFPRLARLLNVLTSTITLFKSQLICLNRGKFSPISKNLSTS